MLMVVCICLDNSIINLIRKQLYERISCQRKLRKIKIVADHLGIEEEKVTEEASFIDDLGADSLDTVELVWLLKKSLGQKFQIAKLKILTVESIKFIESKASN